MVTIAAVALLATGGASATVPAPFHLVFDGKHNAELLHDGTFTTSSSWCPSGAAADVTVEETTLTAIRRFSCAGGGDFTVKVGPLPAEHGGSGSWLIVAGSGPLANLRGKGTFTSIRTGGTPDDPATITFRSTWDGVADFDVTPPIIGITRWSAQKLKHPRTAYNVRLVLSLSDAGGGAVAYSLRVVDPRKPATALVSKSGQTATGTVKLRFRLKVPKSRRIVRINIDASDTVGNKSAFAKKFRLE